VCERMVLTLLSVTMLITVPVSLDVVLVLDVALRVNAAAVTDVLENISVAGLVHSVAELEKEDVATCVVLVSETVVLTLLSATVLVVVQVDSVELLVLETALWVDGVAVLDVIEDVSVAEVLHDVAVLLKDAKIAL